MCADDISQQARRIHFSSIVFDTHTDTAQRFLFGRFDLGRRDTEGCVDIPRLREGGIGAIFFALWVPVEITGPAARQRALDLLDAVEEQVLLHASDLELATSTEEIRNVHRKGKIAVLLGVEGGHAIDDDLGALREFAARGVRYMTLTHNAATGWADSSNQSPRHNGLTEFGKQVIQEMNRIGMVVDISHVSDQTFQDVIAVSRAPVIASHSCCRAICNVPRNMSDDMIEALAARGGVIHITFHNGFLSQAYSDSSKNVPQWNDLRKQVVNPESAPNESREQIEGQRLSDELIREGKLPQVSCEKIIDHIDHAVRLVGADHVGVGSDFDGAFMPEGMKDASMFLWITEGLVRKGYKEDDIRKILGENTLRVMAESKRVACELQSEKP